MHLDQQATHPLSASYPTIVAPGMLFGKLEAIRMEPSPGGRKEWLCKCKCGKETHAPAHRLLSGRRKSCGCIHADKVRDRRKAVNFPDPIPGSRFILLTHGMFAIIDEEDYERISKRIWSARRNKNSDTFYAIGHQRDREGVRRTILMHREILNAPDGMLVDHVEPSMTLDNRKKNLRFANFQQNASNKRNQRNNRTGYKGVRMVGSKTWEAIIQADKRKVYLGRWPSAEEAHAAYCRAARKYHGEFARID